MNFDEQLYSRQVAAYGANSMNKLTKLKILIYRIGGLGIEIAKNIILAGPKKVSIYDDKKIKIEDLGCNFYITEEDIGKRKDEVCLSKLKELNNIEFNLNIMWTSNEMQASPQYALLFNLTDGNILDYYYKHKT